MAAVSSRTQRTARSRFSASRPSMCLYRLGTATPKRFATAARVRRSRPTSSATMAAPATTRSWVSPTRGIRSDRGDHDEQQHEGDALEGGAGVDDAVPAALQRACVWGRDVRAGGGGQLVV